MTISLIHFLAASDQEGNIEIYHNGFNICLAFSILFFVISLILFFAFDIKGIFDMKTGRAEKQKIREMEEENALTGRLINPNQKRGPNAKGKQSTGFSEKLNRLRGGTQSGNMNIPTGVIPEQYYNAQQQFQQQAYAPQPLVIQPSQEQNHESIPSNFEDTDKRSYVEPNQTTVLDESVQHGIDDAGAEQTTLLTEENVALTVGQNYEEDGSLQTTLLSETNVNSMQNVSPSANQGELMQPVHNIVQQNELGKANSSIDFMVGDGETSRLDDMSTTSKKKYDGKFNIIKDIMLVHSNESIS